MADNYIRTGNSLADFYSGSMQPPNIVPGGLSISTIPGTIAPMGPTGRGRPSLAEMYAQSAKPPEGLTTRMVQTVPIDPTTGNPAVQAIDSAAGSTQYYPKGPEYGYNSLTGDYEVRQPGQPYSVGGGKPNTNLAPSPAAQSPIARMFSGWPGWNAPGSGAASLAGLEYDDPKVAAYLNEGSTMPSPALNNPASAPRAAAAAPPPQTPVQSLASMFTPAKNNPGITYDQPLASPGDGSPTVNGYDMAFMPQSVQTSSRWRTVY